MTLRTGGGGGGGGGGQSGTSRFCFFTMSVMITRLIA